MISKFIHSDIGGIIMSLLWGFALALLFRRICNDESCVSVFGPPPEIVRGRRVKWKGKCYIIEPKEVDFIEGEPNIRVIPIR